MTGPTTTTLKNSDGPAALEALADLGKHLPLNGDSKALLPGANSAADFLQRLIDKGQHVDAIRVLAYSMPIRRSVWWGLLCAWHATKGNPEPDRDRALAAATHWVVDPSEARRDAAEAASATGVESPAGCCARAAARAGFIRKRDDPLVPDQPRLAARLVNAAVFLARADLPECTYRDLVDLGVQISQGRLPWDVPPPESTAQRPRSAT